MTNKPHDHQFDFLMFTQLWPISNCIEWEERDHENTCSLNGKYVLFWLAISCKQFPEHLQEPETCLLSFLFVLDDFQWTVHGIWPTKKHTKGPFHCK